MGTNKIKLRLKTYKILNYNGVNLIRTLISLHFKLNNSILSLKPISINPNPIGDNLNKIKVSPNTGINLPFIRTNFNNSGIKLLSIRTNLNYNRINSHLIKISINSLISHNKTKIRYLCKIRTQSNKCKTSPNNVFF